MFTTDSLRTVAVGGQLLRIGAAGAAGRRAARAPRQPAAAAAHQRHRREPGAAAAVRRRARPGDRGRSGSTCPASAARRCRPGPYRFTGLCRLIAGMLTELGYDQADVLGISWGGGVAQQFAAVQRSRCRRLVLVSTANGALMVPARPRVLARMLTPRRYTDRGYLERIARRACTAAAPGPIRPAGRGDERAGNRVGSARGYLYQLAPGPAGRACRSCRCSASRR